MNIKPWIIVLVLSFSIIVAGSIIGSLLASSGIFTAEELESLAVERFSFILFLIMGFSMIPVAIRLFIKGQIFIGNGGLPAILWLQQNEKRVVYGIWGFYLVGLCILLPEIIRDFCL